MSRIHEALQRSAEENSISDAPAEPSTSDDRFEGADITLLSREPFPVELEGARRTRASAAEPPPRVDPSASRPHEAPPPDGGETRSKTLFERIDARLAEKVVVDSKMAPLSREQYRRLAAVLHDAQGNTGLRVVMVASAVPGEGKTLTATNVALTLSDSYRRRVLLIDADLRKPTLHQVFGLNTTSGLIDGLEAKSEVKLVLRQVSENLAVLPAGRPTSDPMAGLTSDRMRRLINEAKEAFDWVIVDTPPLMLLPDAHLLSSLVDAAVLVIKANSTPHEMVKRTADIIGRERILGTVLNQADARLQPSYGGNYYGQYYVSRHEAGSSS